jgi:hypothetical protein
MKAKWMKWARHVASMGERRNTYTDWVEEPDENGPLGRTRCIREDKVEMYLI